MARRSVASVDLPHVTAYSGDMLPSVVLALVVTAEAPRLRVVVPDLDAPGLEAPLVSTVTAVILTHLGQVREATVLGRRDFEQLLNQEQQRQLVGCGKDTRCVASVAGMLDAPRLVWGSIGRVGERYLVTLTLLDTQNNSVVRRVSREARSAEALLDAAGQAADALWLDPEAPAELCVDCEEAARGAPRSTALAVKLGNNFMSFFASGVDVALFGPAFDLDVAYRFSPRLAAVLGAGLSFGHSDSGADRVGFQVVPLNLGIRYYTPRFGAHWTGYGGVAAGVGLVRSALAGGGAVHVDASLVGRAHAGAMYGVTREVGVILEASYELTSHTADELLARSLGAAAVKVGVAYGY